MVDNGQSPSWGRSQSSCASGTYGQAPDPRPPAGMLQMRLGQMCEARVCRNPPSPHVEPGCCALVPENSADDYSNMRESDNVGGREGTSFIGLEVSALKES